jgi:hypothetical protein
MTPFLHTAQSAVGPLYALTLGLAAAGAAVVFAGGLAAFHRRRSASYLLVALALGALLARTAVAACAAVGLVDATTHHLGEHLLDVAMAGLVIAAVYVARSGQEVAT